MESEVAVDILAVSELIPATFAFCGLVGTSVPKLHASVSCSVGMAGVLVFSLLVVFMPWLKRCWMWGCYITD